MNRETQLARHIQCEKHAVDHNLWWQMSTKFLAHSRNEEWEEIRTLWNNPICENVKLRVAVSANMISLLEQIQLLKMASSRNEDWEETWKAASANMISLLEQIQLLKMASSRNEDWEETWKAASANMISLLEQIQLLKMASSRNEDWEGDIFGLPAEQPWQLEIFLLLIWPCETCARSIYPNMLPL